MKLTKNKEDNSQEKVKNNRIIKTIFKIIMLIIFALIVIGIYYLIIMDRTSKPLIKEDMNYQIKIEEFNNRNVYVVSQKGEENPSKVILYLHGGAYIEEMSPEYWYFVEKIVNETDSIIIIPDYPLAPKYNYEDVFNMLEPLYNEIIKKVDLNNFILMGDSAGGGMALSLLEKVNEQNIDTPSETILISPWLDVSMENDKIDEVQKKDTMLNKEVLKLAGIAYAKDINDIKSYLVSPIYGDLSKIKNVTIFTGTNDILNPDVHLLTEKAQEKGIIVKVNEYQDAKHIWIIMNNSDTTITNKAYEDLKIEITQ